MSNLNYLRGGDIQIRRRPDSLFLDCTVEGKDVANVHLVRAFPLSEPKKMISVRDMEQKEIGVIEDLDELDEASRKLADDELDRRYFTPAITKINSLKNDASMWKFDVETTRGHSDFYVRNWRDNAHELTSGRWQITSVDGGRYEILNLDELDDRSQMLIEQLL
ncbi:MAG: DUF1854 domain-containing protein [Armatimonadetes bacterium]|nr:DUF1854 domain-containing protein [Armatimonadota bacterium]MBS1701535.1 DUF1854 domain-containing protein [Armatimonadota bacterium]MBS1725722.1 DUF1854 domain-containing protein [Armatimonadota bacterium]